jgi:PPP family 3-phenylpropionic acid transporter
VAGDWGRYGRIRLCGSAGFLLTVFVAGEWFDRFGMKHFPAWAAGTLAIVLIATMKLPDVREPPAAHDAVKEPIGPVLRNPSVQWFFAALFFQVMSHFSVYAFFSLYLDSIGYGKSTIGLRWALSVVAEIVWFFLQGRLIGLMPMPRWMLVCGIAAVARLGLTAGLGGWIAALILAQWLHALSFAAHHTTCIAVVSRRFPGHLRGRGQALFTVIGYGFGGVLGVLLGGAIAQAFGYRTMFTAAALLAVLGSACAWRVMKLDRMERAVRA